MTDLLAMYAAAGKALRERSVIRPTFDEMAQAAVDAALAAAGKRRSSFVGMNNYDVIVVDEPGIYAVVRMGESE